MGEYLVNPPFHPIPILPHISQFTPSYFDISGLEGMEEDSYQLIKEKRCLYIDTATLIKIRSFI
jgi:hypothetical protein